MMMQISSTIPAHNRHMFLARRASFKCQVSPLNPTLMPASSSTDATRLHLANLDKLLQKNPPPPTTFQPQPDTKEVQNEKKPKTVLEGLNLARLWPEMKATEEMSPRHMNRLQRLLSMTPEYSPRNILSSRWREYHGSNDWKGMLDPLDENLRREVVRYGEFVQAAYHCFHSNPATSPEDPPIPPHVVLSDRSYRVTKGLYATSSIGLPKWVDDVAPDLGWMTQRSSWVGYVAVCDDRREINRMGRRDIVIALRGTATCLEWAENMRAQLSDMDESHETDNRPKVECGFLSLYRTQGAHVASLAESVKEEVKRLREMYKGETLSITVTGHSLGAALALLVADDISSEEEMPPVAVFSFGGPRVGNSEFGDRIAGKEVKVLRIVNSQDVITNVPLGAYSHVGSELRLDIKNSPYLRPDADMACCHDLEAYLHLVDGFLASNCPFRTNAKRSLARLMQDQGSNVKKLYSSKAKALSVNIERQGSFSMSNIQRQGSFSMSTCLPSPS